MGFLFLHDLIHLIALFCFPYDDYFLSNKSQFNSSIYFTSFLIIDRRANDFKISKLTTVAGSVITSLQFSLLHTV